MKRLLFLMAVVLTLSVTLKAISLIQFEQITVANSAIGFTSGKVTAGLGHAQMNWASCRARTAEMSYTYDGVTTPTSTVGQLLEPGDTITITNPGAIQNFKAIRTTGTSGQLDCVYTD